MLNGVYDWITEKNLRSSKLVSQRDARDAFDEEVDEAGIQGIITVSDEDDSSRVLFGTHI